MKYRSARSTAWAGAGVPTPAAGCLLESGSVASSLKPRYVDVANPALAIDCPRCGLRTARFMEHCRNCGYALWPGSRVASAAFRAWRDHDPARAAARRFDLVIPVQVEPPVVDYEQRAHQLGIHIFPSSAYPFPIAVGLMILFFALVPFGEAWWLRLAIGLAGAAILLYGVVGWVIVEDVRYYPSDALEVEQPDADTAQGESH